jgi:inosose dehydratase
MSLVTRRQSIGTLSAAMIGSALPSRAATQQAYRFGYAAITWGGNDRQAMADIADVGFRGIQLRTSAVQAFGEQPTALEDCSLRTG